MEKTSSDVVKRQRKKLRARHKGFADSAENMHFNYIFRKYMSLYFECFELIESCNHSHLIKFIAFLRKRNTKTRPTATEFTQRVVAFRLPLVFYIFIDH